MKKILLNVLIFLLIPVFIFPGGVKEKSTTTTTTEVSGTINFYTSSVRPLADKLVSDFQVLYPKIQVNVYRSGTGEIIAKLQTEIEAGAIQADVVSFTDINYYALLSNKDMLHQYIPENAKNISKNYIYENGKYLDFFVMTVALGYNTLQVKNPPNSWYDLIDPKYKNKVGIPNPVYSGVALSTLGTIVKNNEFGWDYYKKLKENGLKIFRGNPATAQAIASGEIQIGIVSYGDLLAMKQKGSPVDFIFLKEGGPLISQPIGIMKSSSNIKAAELFENYIFSEPGLKTVAEMSGFATTNPSIVPEGIKLENIKIMPTDWDYVNNKKDEMLDEFQKIFGKQ